MQSNARRGTTPWDHAAVAVAASVVFAFAAAHRIVDDDEGYYALAGRALAEGRLPYRDFFFPQMPLGAAAYGVCRALLGPGLVPLRAFAATSAVATTLCVHHGARRLSGPAGGAIASLLFVGHTLVWEWAPTIKTFPLGLLFATAALVVATAPTMTPRRAAAAAFLGALAVGARALSLPALAGVALGVWLRRDAGAPPGRLARGAAAGFAVGITPVLALAARDPRAFWFDNVTYHALRSPGEGLVKDALQKLDVARAVFLSPLGEHRPDATGIQTSLLVVGALAAFLLASRSSAAAAPSPRAAGPSRAELAPYLLSALLLAITSFLPSPAWPQYFVAVVPPASVVVGAWLGAAARARGVIALALLAYVAVAVPSFEDRLIRQAEALRPASLDAVGRALDPVTPMGRAVAAHWPAYLVASRREPLAEATNQFARLFSDRVPPDVRRRFHLYTEDELAGALLRREAATFVVGTFVVPETALALKAAGWQRSPVVLPGATLWLAPGGAP